MPEPTRLGGLAKRRRPDYGPRPTWLFVAAFSLTIAWVALAVYLSDPWRSDLEDAIGPIAAWVIPILLAYIPALIIGFLAFTLILSPYRFPVLAPPEGRLAGRRVAAGHDRYRSVERGGFDCRDARADRRPLLPRRDRGRPGGQQLDRPDSGDRTSRRRSATVSAIAACSRPSRASTGR